MEAFAELSFKFRALRSAAAVSQLAPLHARATSIGLCMHAPLWLGTAAVNEMQLQKLDCPLAPHSRLERAHKTDSAHTIALCSAERCC